MVCYNDQITLMILEALRDEGIKVPEDFSLISFDDSSLAVASEVKLSSIKHPKAVMGRQAARFILDMIENKVSKPRQVYQPELTLRSSCRALVYGWYRRGEFFWEKEENVKKGGEKIYYKLSAQLGFSSANSITRESAN